MIALVIVAGKAMAQGSLAPYANGTTVYTYKWENVTGATSQNFWVTTTAPTMAALPSADQSTSDFTKDAATITAASSTVTITWNSSAAGNTYYVTLVASSTNSCSNFRYVKVLPKDPVRFEIYAVGVSGASAGTGLTFTNNATGAALTVCPPDTRDGADYDETDNTVADGSVYVFYRIDRVNGLVTNDWTANVAVTPSLAASIANTDYTIDNGTTWTPVPATGNVTNDAGNNSILVRVKIGVPVGENPNALVGAIDPANTYETAGSMQILDYTTTIPGDNSVTFTVNNVPSFGSFSEN